MIDRIESLEETINKQSIELERSRVVNEEGFMREKELEKIVEEVCLVAVFFDGVF